MNSNSLKSGLKAPSKVPKLSVAKPKTTLSVKNQKNSNPVGVKRSRSPTITTNEKENGGGSHTPKRKKRAAWDTKGRLEDMEELSFYLREKLGANAKQMSDLAETLSANQKQLTSTTEANKQLESSISEKTLEIQRLRHALQQAELEVASTKRHLETELLLARSEGERAAAQLRDDIERSNRKYAEQIQCLHDEHKRKLSNTVSDYDEKLEKMAKALKTTKLELELKEQEAMTLSGTVQTMTASQFGTQAELEQTKRLLRAKSEELAQRESDIDALKAALAHKNGEYNDLNANFKEGEKLRRELHNTIQELKGNIRVFCRVRPLLPKEAASSDAASSQMQLDGAKSGDIVLSHQVESGTGKGSVTKQFPFHFDKVFAPESMQADVFDEISQLVQSSLDGYNVSIFAYGQTGSGKTFTMEGPSSIDLGQVSEMSGMIPRAVAQIFDSAASAKRGWEYEFFSQMVEIYNETLQDLLAVDPAPKKLEIKHLSTEKTIVSDLTVCKVESQQQVYALLKRAQANRSQASTLCNERSSRSHSVFTLHITGRNAATGETLCGDLNLIDLAGSERLNSSGSVGERLKETQAINKSLTCLGDTIYALANKGAHVPYRNSKLTYLLQNSLGGNSKTLMFVNVSPAVASFGETLNSLRFAAKVNSCQIGTATRRVGFKE